MSRRYQTDFAPLNTCKRDEFMSLWSTFYPPAQLTLACAYAVAIFPTFIEECHTLALLRQPGLVMYGHNCAGPIAGPQCLFLTAEYSHSDSDIRLPLDCYDEMLCFKFYSAVGNPICHN